MPDGAAGGALCSIGEWGQSRREAAPSAERAERMSDIEYVYPLIHNKVTSPHYVTPTLRRARLLDWLHDSATCRAVVIAADAGYGKTTLLWQWEREVDFPCYWYKMDRNDRDWSLHISYLIEAISQRHAGFGRRAHSMLQQLGGPGTSRPGVAAYLLGEMYERLTEPCTFIVDDWQFVSSVTEVRGLWNQILRDAPPTCRFIFLSRAKPRLQFARFKTHSGYAEMRTDALRFTDREIEELFRDIYQDPLDPSELVELERRTEGWAASLQLVEVSLRERKTPAERRSFIESITATRDSDLFSFLAEEVLDQQPTQIRDFLLSTSILQEMTGELAERLSGAAEGARILADLEQRGLFTFRVDSQETVFRFHNLFRDFLEHRLAIEKSPGEITGLHIHAASYYETHQQWPGAIHHYLQAGLQPQAARLISRYGEDVVAEGRLGSVDEWLQQLPTRVKRENARLSLLVGEASGMRGEWETAINALQRSRTYFARKGDKRMEALACLKLSTVHANKGQVADAADIAKKGLDLAPPDAFATRLRLQGNLAITATWMNDSLEDVGKACRRIIVESRARGFDHFAAIGLHNLGVAERYMGRTKDSIRSLRQAAEFWAGIPSSPFADNAELVLSLLADNQVRAGELVADAAIGRTRPWPRPNAEAQYGRANVLVHRGRFDEASEILNRILANPVALGPTAELANALLVESTFLAGADAGVIAQVSSPLLNGDRTDPRQTPVVAAAKAIALHYSAPCGGNCLEAASTLREWRDRGAHAPAAQGELKLGALALLHRGPRAARLSEAGFRTSSEDGLLQSGKQWLRRYAQSDTWLAANVDLLEDYLRVGSADPEAWRGPLARLIDRTTGEARGSILRFVGHHASKETTRALQEIVGSDVAEVRRALLNRQAPKAFVTSLGSISVHRGSWETPGQPIEKKRMRTLLGLLVARAGTAIAREVVLDELWPDAEPAAAVNNLNQAVFQLRRVFDADYRDGDSPQYLISTVDAVQLNPETVVTDIQAVRDLGEGLVTGLPPESKREIAGELAQHVAGEFLAELRYEDWAARAQVGIHAEVRQIVLPLIAHDQDIDHDLAIRLASALILLDPYDEEAHAIRATHLAQSGRRAAARETINTFVKQLRTDFDEAPSNRLSGLLSDLKR